MTRPSLREQLLQRLVPALLAILILGGGAAYWVAWRNATLAYDRSLLDVGLAVAEQLHFDGGEASLHLTPQARKVLLTDKFDEIFFAVYTSDGVLIDGQTGLPLPSEALNATLKQEGRVYYDGRAGNTAVRLAALSTHRQGHDFIVVSAETLVKRKALVQELIIGVLIPKLFLIIATLTVVLVSVRTALSPLAELRQELSGRSQTDLRPITSDMPEEMQPLIGEINGLMSRLDHSLESQRHFVSDAAHQLRTPIAALQAQVEATLGEADPGIRPQLEGIHAGTRRLSHLVDQLLSLARAEPQLNENSPVVYLPELVTRQAEVWLPHAISKQIDLGFDLGEGKVRGNAFLLEEVLSNLLDNALRHTPAGGSVTVSCRCHDGKAILMVDDSGPGIPPTERRKVLERFYQTTGSQRQQDGCGLGLAIVDKIVRQHQGEILIDEAPELGGTRIQISFPACSADAPAPTGP